MTRAAGLAASIARPVRPLVDRVFPRGALLLSTLTLATYAMGLLRNKVFASAYGLGTELDAYLYAFFLPEIVFDVIAASGLTAPFVPILTRLRRDDAASSQRFAPSASTLSLRCAKTDISFQLSAACYQRHQLRLGALAESRQLKAES